MKTQSGRSRVVIGSAICLTGALLAGWPALRPTPTVRLGAQESGPRVAAPAQPADKTPADKTPADKTPANSSSRPKPTELASVRLPLFEGWEKPDVALVLTGRLAGYIEPCGCAGLANQKGGLTRRFTLLNDLRKQGWTLVPLDVGDQIKRFGRQSEIKFQMTFEGLKLMDYQAIGLGPHDLRLSSGELFAAISDQPARFVCANAAVLDRELLPRSVAIEANGWKIGVTAVLGDEYRRDIRVDEVTHEPAADGLRLAWAQLEREKCDLHVMLVYGSLAETHRLARQFPQFQLVVTTGGGEEPPLAPEPVPNTSTPVIQVGGKGMYVGVLGLYRSGDETVRYQRVPLDDRFADTPAMLELLSAYQDQLQAAGLEGLGVKPQAHPSGRSFVGTAACGDCHTKALAAFEKTSHAHALDTLVHPRERSAISRQHDPECLSCHVTGWNPQLQLPFKSGYLSLESTAERVHVGCENCHGPGSAHVAAEENDQTTAAARDKLRQEMRLPLAKARNKCVECHDLDNSPAFQLEGAFERYWKKVEHVGKD